MKLITCKFIVMDKLDTIQTRDGNTIHQFLVGDASGCIILSLWDAKGAATNPGDIILVRDGYIHVSFFFFLSCFCFRAERMGRCFSPLRLLHTYDTSCLCANNTPTSCFWWLKMFDLISKVNTHSYLLLRYCSLYRGSATLYCGEKGKLEKHGEYVWR
jgi:hypothetical protein